MDQLRNSTATQTLVCYIIIIDLHTLTGMRTCIIVFISLRPQTVASGVFITSTWPSVVNHAKIALSLSPDKLHTYTLRDLTSERLIHGYLELFLSVGAWWLYTMVF